MGLIRYIRIALIRCSSLFYFKKKSKVIFYHDIHSNMKYTSMSTPIELFKKHILHPRSYNSARGGDLDICKVNFNLFCSLKNLVYLHLGSNEGENHYGKTISFNDDANISLEQIYFNCNINCINKYYDKNRNEVELSSE